MFILLMLPCDGRSYGWISRWILASTAEAKQPRPCPVVAWQRLDGRGLASGAAGHGHLTLRGVVSNSFSVVTRIIVITGSIYVSKSI